MNAKLHNFILTIAALGIGSLPVVAQCPPEGDEDDDISERGIVHVRADSTIDAFLADLAIIHPTLGVVVLEQIPGRRIYLLGFDIPPGEEEELEVELDEDFGTTLVSGEFLYEAHAPEGKTGSTWVDGLERNDYEQQFTPRLVGSPIAHERSTGRGTVVAVLDTGVDATHPDLADRVLPFGYDFVDGDDDPSDIGDGINNDPDEDDDIDEMTGHGTFVAGLVTLIAPDTKILPVRILNSDGGGDGWTLTQGLYYAIDHGVEVINMSVGSTYDTASVKQAILEAAARGIVVVAAAGNWNCEDVRVRPAMDDIDAGDNETSPPIDLIGAFGVAATDSNDVKWGDSNFHEKLVISAPGAPDSADPGLAIVSTLPKGAYGAWEGTSFATPLVAGTIALVRAQHPERRPGDWQPDEWAAGEGAPDFGIYNLVQTRITNYAVNHYPLNDPMYTGMLGAGRLDTAATVDAGPIAPAHGDINADGVVGFADILEVLGDWGLVHSSADLDGDGMVGFSDVLRVLKNWG